MDVCEWRVSDVSVRTGGRLDGSTVDWTEFSLTTLDRRRHRCTAVTWQLGRHVIAPRGRLTDELTARRTTIPAQTACDCLTTRGRLTTQIARRHWTTLRQHRQSQRIISRHLRHFAHLNTLHDYIATKIECKLKALLGLVVARWYRSTKLLYAGSDYYWDADG